MQIHIDPYRSITWPKVNRLEWNRKGLCGLRAHETLVTRQVLTDFVDAYDVLREMEDEKEDCRAVDQNEHYLELSWIILPIQIDICSQHVSSCLYVDSTTLFAMQCWVGGLSSG